MEALMAEFWNYVRLQVHRVIRAEISRNSVGIVTGYDPDKHMAKVKIQPFDNETGWIPINAHHIGNGYGVMVGLNMGDQVEIGYQEGDPNTPRIIGRYHSDKDKPPKVESGEILIQSQWGQSIHFKKDGHIYLVTPNGEVHFNDGGSGGGGGGGEGAPMS